MNGAEEAYAFVRQQPAMQPRHIVHPRCAHSTAFPALFASWTSKVATGKATRAARNTDESSRNTSQLLDPNTRPTKDRFVFPWQSQMTDIEWAVATVLKTKYPDIHREIIRAACQHGGFLEADSEQFLSSPQPQQPHADTTRDATDPADNHEAKQQPSQTGQSPLLACPDVRSDDRKEPST